MELERRRRAKFNLPLLDFVPALTPRWQRPTHLAPIAELFERAYRESVYACVSVPPRHGKTELEMHAIAQWLARRPQDMIAYVSYAIDFALGKSKTIRDYASKIGVQLRSDYSAAAEWHTTDGGGLIATGIGGQLTGKGCQLLIIDDPHKDRAEAESLTMRTGVSDWIRGTASSRVEPNGSIIVVHTRWHPDDLIGTLSRDKGTHWDVVSLPAIDEWGRALWPERWPVEELERRRLIAGPYEWASLYMGEPRPREGKIFQDVRFCNALPESGYRVGIGIDLAYAAKTKSDYSTIVVMMEAGGIYYVAECIKVQMRAPAFKEILGSVMQRYPSVRPRWYCSGVELGAADLIGGIDARPATTDKMIRSGPVSVAWNSNLISVPKEAPWLNTFLAEILDFSGKGDAHDDIVDAFAAAFDSIAKKTSDYESMTEASAW